MSTTTGAMTSEEAVCEAASSSHIQVVSFLLGDEKYGINIVNVQEIIRIDRITQMPHVPDHVRGLSNLRGHVIPIIDLRMSFALPATATTESSRIIVLSILDKTIGIIVDAVDEVLRVNESQIEPAPQSLIGAAGAHVAGLIKFESKLLIMLNIERIVSSEACVVAPGAFPARC